MRWMDRMNERAHLMGRMLETIGAMDHLPQGRGLDTDMRMAATRCMCCSHTTECAAWLKENSDGADAPMEGCPNATLFKGWLTDS